MDSAYVVVQDQIQQPWIPWKIRPQWWNYPSQITAYGMTILQDFQALRIIYLEIHTYFTCILLPAAYLEQKNNPLEEAPVVPD